MSHKMYSIANWPLQLLHTSRAKRDIGCCYCILCYSRTISNGVMYQHVRAFCGIAVFIGPARGKPVDFGMLNTAKQFKR